MTNIVERAAAGADELDAEELVTGQQQLAAKVQHYRPQFWLFWGSVHRTAFNRPKAHGATGRVLYECYHLVLPNPSGLNAHYQLEDLKRVYRELLVALKT